METSLSLPGRCFCGEVRYQLTAPTDFAGHCHCLSCRRATGAPMVTWTAVAKERFLLTAGTELLQSYASSDRVTWQFCGRCGTTLFYRSTDSPEKIYLTVASLEALDRPVDHHVSYEEKASWLDLSAELPRYLAKTNQRLSP